MTPGATPAIRDSSRGTSPGAALYICHCGQNIASTVDVEAVARAFEKAPGVSVVRHYPYMCSRPGQDLILKDLRELPVGRVVVAACSPRMHEATFRKALASEGLNPYLFHHVNIREQCSWVHPDRETATDKAENLVAMGLARVRLQEPLTGSEAPVTPRALILGGGPAGLAAAADLAAMGQEVVVVERSELLGGRARDFGRSFPEGGEVGPWLQRKIASVENDPRVEILFESRLEALTGAPGNFDAGILTPAGTIQRRVGAVVVATGSALYRPDDPLEGRPELGFGDDPRIVTQEWLESRLRSSPEPLTFEGRPIRSAAFLQCIGSRDRTTGAAHCSRVCCMVSVRQAEDLKECLPEADVQVLYTDLRAYARGAEEAYESAARKGVLFRRGSASEIYRKDEQLAVRFEDTLLGCAEELRADLVILACGARPRADTAELSRALRTALGPDGFFLEAHPKLRPSETAVEGIYLAGACQGPKTLDEAVSSGRAAAAKAAAALLRGSIAVDPVTAEIDTDRCSGCGLCAGICPASAIAEVPHLGTLAVETAACQGCGACAGTCPSGAVSLRHYRKEQVLAEIEEAGS